MISIHVNEKTLPEAWQAAVERCWAEGARFRTEYDKPGDPESRDVLAVIHVTDPFAEPRIHRAMPGGLNDLEKYRMEVVCGVHDHWIDPKAGKWTYTYHERLRRYCVDLWANKPRYDQIADAVKKLREAPFTRRAQVVTWQVWNDVGTVDPPCLQRLWFRVEEGRLNMVCHIRSNDAYKAGFMNMYAFTEIQRYVAEQLQVGLGEYIHVADSFHIYGSYFDEFENFLDLVASRSKEDLCYETSFAESFFIDGLNELLAEDDMPSLKKDMVEQRLQELGVTKIESGEVIKEE